MDIVIIGTGNVATVLGRKLLAGGHQIVQIFGRNAAAASALAYEFDSESTQYWSVINKDADVYLIAVADDALPEVAANFKVGKGTVVHTAASVSKNILNECATRYGVFYPLQSLNKNSKNLPNIPLLIDGVDRETLLVLSTLAQSISSQVIVATDEVRQKMHVAAVFCSNFTNHLYALMEQFCKNEGLPFSVLHPLIQETALRLAHSPAAAMQTGPALRRDEATLSKHRQALQQYPQLLKLYHDLTVSIQNTHPPSD